MIDITAFSKRIRRRTIAAATLFFGGAFMLVVDFTTKIPTAEKGEFAFVWLFLMAIGGFFYYLSMELPSKEIMQMAENHKGLLTVGEIATALAINPDLALRTLHHLQHLGIAAPRWQELQKNLWEFPDYIQLPISQAIDLAQKQGGRLTLQDLITSGHSVEIAQQTFDVIQEKGLARQQPSNPLSLLLGQQ